jgi:hypothetical protein
VDVAYILGYARNNEELRFSLRSVDKNLKHDGVILSGFPPEWTQNTARLSVPAKGAARKFLNAARNMLAICQWEDTSQEFILMNDDFFVIEPVDEVQTHHRGYLERAIEIQFKKWGNSPYYKGMVATLEYLRGIGIDNPLAYHLHVPMVVDKTIMEEVLIDTGVTSPKPSTRPNYLLRTIYGNVANVGGTRSRDVKVASLKSADLTSVLRHGSPYLSTGDQSWRSGAVGRYIVGQFPDPCQYEVTQYRKKRSRRPNPQHRFRQR